MSVKALISLLLTLSVLLLTPGLSAQDSEQPAAPSPEPSAEEQATEEEANPGSREVEYSEDNYRRFMELKDQNLQKNSLPTNAYQPGKQKLDELPEASQKHLRNQLREIILQEGKWAEGDESKEYAYVPSEAAETNNGLKQQEAEAWDELVGEYQAREAQIHANSVRSDAAGAAAQPGGAESGMSSSMSATGGDGKGADKGNTGQQNQAAQAQESTSDERSDTYSPAKMATANNADTNSTEGVSESAMEFLMKNAGTESGGQPGDTQSPANQQTGSGTQKQAEAAMANSGTNAAQAEAAIAGAAPSSANETDAESTAGTSENAMKFLMANKGQNGETQPAEMQPGDEAETGQLTQSGSQSSQQNSLPELPSLKQSTMNQQTTTDDPAGQENKQVDASSYATPLSASDPDQFEVISKDTLSIKELLNAQGVIDPDRGEPAQTPGETDTTQTPAKDDDG